MSDNNDIRGGARPNALHLARRVFGRGGSAAVLQRTTVACIWGRCTGSVVSVAILHGGARARLVVPRCAARATHGTLIGVQRVRPVIWIIIGDPHAVCNVKSMLHWAR